MDVVASSSGGVGTGGPNWEFIPCTNDNGKLIATLVKTGMYVFVSIEKIFQAVLGNTCELLAGLNRTIEWAESFTMDCKTAFQNKLNVTTKEVSEHGDAAQRHRDCGEDMGHFFDVSLERIDLDFESSLDFFYTEQMLTQKGKCSTCGKNLRWAFFDELDSMWKFPEQRSEVDVNKKQCKQQAKNTKDKKLPKSWAVMYAAEVAGNGTSSTGGGGSTGMPGWTGDDEHSAAVPAINFSFSVFAGLVLLALHSAAQ
jgi:hypothetical protein